MILVVTNYIECQVTVTRNTSWTGQQGGFKARKKTHDNRCGVERKKQEESAGMHGIMDGGW